VTFDDAALIAGARQGSAEAVDSLYRRYWPIAWQWAYALTGHRQCADDLAQDAVLSAFASLGRFDVERPFRPWLKRILLNRSIDELRRLRRGELPVDWFDDRLRPRGEEELRASDELVAAGAGAAAGAPDRDRPPLLARPAVDEIAAGRSRRCSSTTRSRTSRAGTGASAVLRAPIYLLPFPLGKKTWRLQVNTRHQTMTGRRVILQRRTASGDWVQIRRAKLKPLGTFGMYGAVSLSSSAG
jgi:RNA polymerase sigma factor (sigma-70 family)